MSDSLNTPQPATVFALSLDRLRGTESWGSLEKAFSGRLGATVAGICSIAKLPDEENPSYLAVVIDGTAQALAPLRRLLALQQDFAQSHPDCRVRLLAHHGLVFASSGGFLGSAVRAARRRLGQIPAECTAAASEEFVAYAMAWKGAPVVFPPLEAVRGLYAVAFTTPQGTGEGSAASLENLAPRFKSLLAVHLGPFAEVLTDAALRTARSPHQLIEELAAEIDREADRQIFRTQAQALLDQA